MTYYSIMLIMNMNFLKLIFFKDIYINFCTLSNDLNLMIELLLNLYNTNDAQDANNDTQDQTINCQINIFSCTVTIVLIQRSHFII